MDSSSTESRDIFKEIRTKAKELAKNTELSKAIDLCSTAFRVYSKGNPSQPMSNPWLHPSESVIRGYEFPSALSKLVSKRGDCYRKRNWHGDNMAAVRDLLFAIMLDPHVRKNYLRLTQTLTAMRQFGLAKECCKLYARRFPGDAYVEQLESTIFGTNVIKSITG